MADTAETTAVSTTEDEDKEILELARKRRKYCADAYDKDREWQKDDAKFFAGSPDNGWQWPSTLLNDRKNDPNGPRPCITVNKQRQHVRQITNEQRQNRPQGKVIPVDSKADPQTAEMQNGMLRHVDSQSDADTAYDTACESQVVMGEGYFRVVTAEIAGPGSPQDIFKRRIANTHSVWLDPNLQDPAGADAEYGFIEQMVPEAEFERDYPSAKPIDWQACSKEFPQWYDNGEKKVLIAEYFYRKDGKITWCKLSGQDVLDKRPWLGKWIPIVLVEGNADWIEGVCHRSGLVRNTKDSQRMYNYAASVEVEQGSLAPKAPVIGAVGQFETARESWKQANTKNYAYLEFDVVTDQAGRALPPPQRAQPPQASSMIMEWKRGAADDIKSETGQYDPSLGNNAQSQSGIALQREQKKTEIANFHYIDNLSRSIRHGDRIVLDLIPKVYDTKRIARILGLDGEPDYVQIDPSLQTSFASLNDETGREIGKIFNPCVGVYDVSVTVGPSYTTQRQEASAMLTELAQGASDPVVQLATRYLAVKSMDFAGAQEMADLFKRLLPPGIVEDKKDGAPELPPEARDAIEQMKAQVQQKEQELQAAAQQLDQQSQAVQQGKGDVDKAAAKVKDDLAKMAAQQMALDHERAMFEMEKKLAEKDALLKGKELASQQADIRRAQEGVDTDKSEVAATQTAIQQLAEMMAQGFAQLAELVTAPRETELIMDDQGNPVSSVTRVSQRPQQQQTIQ